jgi:alcohol dehydrogenase (cytochrome c)
MIGRKSILKRSRFTLAVLTAVLVGSVAPMAFAQADAPFVPVTNDMMLNPPPEDWLTFRRTLDNQGYSPLDQINRENVADLKLVWSRSLAPGNMEGTPLVHDGVMYMPQPAGVISAYDATNGDKIWEYRRTMPEDLADFAAITDITRSLSIYENKILSLTSDGYVIALNAETGALEWETQITDYKTAPILQSAGPTVINGKILSGRSCMPAAGPEGCFIAAHDVNTGEELWRTHLIPRPGEPGDETWGNIPYEARWHVGSWGTPSYDPELNLAYFGTSVTAPSAKWITGSDDQDRDHLYQTSTLAVDIDTGEIKWYQQHIRDQWDLDHPFERILVDTAINPDAAEVRWINTENAKGEHKVLTGIPGKTGIFYSIDRATGQFLWARETVHQNVITDIDPANGRATMNADLFFDSVDDVHEVCPAAIGGKDWPAGAYSPLTNAIYYPLQNLCMTTQPEGDEPDVEGLYMVSLDAKAAPGEENLGTVRGISVETGKELWKYEQRANALALVTTGGWLVFGGDVNRRFRAFDQETGDILWETVLGGPVGGFPISYAVDGKQYIAVATGNFLISGSYLGLTPELSGGGEGNTLYVFALPDAE